ncbi:MAG: type I-G CRISPR-associated protein Csb2 [Brooklawnia sp.]
MPKLTIRARFPLGVYQGHATDGSSDPFPDTARLHSALLQAASKGSLAIERDGDLRASAASLAALSWMERHPPTALMIPQARRVSPRGIVNYRDDGSWVSRESRVRKQVSSRVISHGHALAGDYGWLWDEVPGDVVLILEALCPDVICLGETECPVILTTNPIEPTHWLQTGSTQLRRLGLTVRTPAPGRIEALESAYEAANPVKLPSVAQDAFKQNESSRGSPVELGGLEVREYRTEAVAPPPIPWPSAIVLKTSGQIPTDQRVEWSVAVHRMLAARLGDNCPPSITGKYAKGVPQPANRIAIQYVSAALLGERDDLPNGAFLLMLPSGFAPDDRRVLTRGLRGRLRVFCRHGQMELNHHDELSLKDFWPSPAPGWVRYWRASPALVPETRRQPTKQGVAWTLEQAALLSLGFVLRDYVGQGLERRDYWQYTERVAERGARVLKSRLVAESDLRKFAHTVSAAAGVVQPYEALLDLGELADDRTLLAMGQSRHLGGGLLIPLDMPDEGEPWN